MVLRQYLLIILYNTSYLEDGRVPCESKVQLILKN